MAWLGWVIALTVSVMPSMSAMTCIDTRTGSLEENTGSLGCSPVSARWSA
jgi:hypothetical protein